MQKVEIGCLGFADKCYEWEMGDGQGGFVGKKKFHFGFHDYHW